MTRSWRIVKKKHAATAFDGEGARRSGGRWNSPGTSMVYTSGSISLAVLEMLVHLDSSRILPLYNLIEVQFPDPLVEDFPESGLPPDWQAHPPVHESRAIGDRWIMEDRSAVLRVPSAVVPTESNYLLNPRNPDFKNITTLKPIEWTIDTRLR